MQEIILFILCFILVYIVYQFFVVLKSKRNVGKKNYKEPFEVLYLKKRYRFNMKKVNYNKLLQVIAFVSSFDIALTVSLIGNIDNMIVQLLLGFVIIILLILISYHIVYLIYKRKGLIIDERNK